MKIIHNQNSEKLFFLNTINGGKGFPDTLHTGEKELLNKLAEAFTIINGGQFKKRRQSA